MSGGGKSLAGLVAVSLAAVATLPVFVNFSLAPAISRLVIEGARREAERIAVHLAEPFSDASGLIRPERVTPEFRETMARHMRSFNLEKLKVFSPSGEIVFATEPVEEGMVYSKTYFRELVTTGRTLTNVVRRNGRTEEGRIAQLDLVETYVPFPREGKVAGVLEIYCDITPRTSALNRLIGRANSTMVIVAASFLAALVIAAWRAGRAVRELERECERGSERAAAALREQREARDRLERSG